MKPDFRNRAKEHFKSARALLTQPGENAARYACLELRMAIEALTYQLLEVYLSETPNTIMKQWTPKKIMDELLAIDPRADKSVKLFVGIEETPGVESLDMKYLGEDKRFTIKWGNKAHNSLGSFLHELTIGEFEKGKDKSESAIRAKAEEIIAEIEEIFAANIFNVNFGEFAVFHCSCGFTIRRKTNILDLTKPVVCGNCGRQYICKLNEDKTSFGFEPDRFHYECQSCKQRAYIDVHLVKEGSTAVCDCGARARISLQYALTTLT